MKKFLISDFFYLKFYFVKNSHEKVSHRTFIKIMQPTQRITIEEINSQPKQIQNHNKKILNLCTCITDTLAHSRVCSKDERWAIIIKLLLYLKTYPNYISNGAKTHKSLYSLWFDRRRAEERERA